MRTARDLAVFIVYYFRYNYFEKYYFKLTGSGLVEAEIRISYSGANP